MKDLGSHLGIELGPSCSEGRALTDYVLILDPWCIAHKKAVRVALLFLLQWNFDLMNLYITKSSV